LPQLFKSQVGLAFELIADGLAMSGDNLRLASRTMVLGPDVSRLAPLLDELFDHAQGHAKAPGNLIPGAFTIVVGSKNAFAQVEGERDPLRPCRHGADI
jgi:hypothetical protein